MVADTTLYEILEVQPNAPESQIKKNYHRLAKKYHPDKNTSRETEEKFKELTFAYEVLTDSSKRSMYDKFGLDAVREGGSGGASAGGTFSLSIIISTQNESFFSIFYQEISVQ